MPLTPTFTAAAKDASNVDPADWAAVVNASIAQDPSASRAVMETARSAEILATASDTCGVFPYHLTAAMSPYVDAHAEAAITAAGVTEELPKTHYRRIVQGLKMLGLWTSLENAYLIGTAYQSSSTSLKSLTGTSLAAGTSTFSDFHATFNGSSNEYTFSNVNPGTSLTGKAFVSFYKHTGASGSVNALVSNYAGGSTRGPGLFVAGGPTTGTGGAALDNVLVFGSIDGTAVVEHGVDLGSDQKWGFAGYSLASGVLTAYANSRVKAYASLATLWANNANFRIGANPNGTHWFTGQMCFAAVWNAGLTDAQMFAVKALLESVFASSQTLNGAVVFEGNSLTASAPGGGTTWPAKLLATTGWTTVTRTENFAADGARQTGRVEGQYFAGPRRWLATGGQDKLFFLWSGINDITAGVSTAAIIASLRREIVRAKLDGFRVVALTLTPVAPSGSGTTYTYTAGQLTQIADINAWLLDMSNHHADQVVDLNEIADTYPEFADATDSTYYIAGDGLHHNDAGRVLIAAKVAAEVSPPAVP